MIEKHKTSNSITKQSYEKCFSSKSKMSKVCTVKLLYCKKCDSVGIKRKMGKGISRRQSSAVWRWEQGTWGTWSLFLVLPPSQWPDSSAAPVTHLSQAVQPQPTAAPGHCPTCARNNLFNKKLLPLISTWRCPKFSFKWQRKSHYHNVY